MINTETLEEIRMDLRAEWSKLNRTKKIALEVFYESKFDLLAELIDISKGEDNERKFEGCNVCESGQNNSENKRGW